MLYVLDTDLLSILQQNRQPECDRLSARLDEQPPEAICTTIVNFQEQALGWAAYLNRARKPLDVLKAYRELFLIESYYRDFEILPFDAAAQAHFERFKKEKIHVKTLDLRIASVAIAQGAMLLTRNLRDFRKVPGLSVEDWSK
jgi:tRNA(fMet)-specific endonuclease VapC